MSCNTPDQVLQPRLRLRLADHLASAVWATPLSLATTQGILSFPAGTKMFQFPACPPFDLCVQSTVSGLPPDGFPHSDTLGLAPAHGSPRLFAVYHVLLRLLTPRHPPSALSSFSRDMEKLKFSQLLYCMSSLRSIVKVRQALFRLTPPAS